MLAGSGQLVGLSSLAAWEVTLSGQWKGLGGQRDCAQRYPARDQQR